MTVETRNAWSEYAQPATSDHIILLVLVMVCISAYSGVKVHLTGARNSESAPKSATTAINPDNGPTIRHPEIPATIIHNTTMIVRRGCILARQTVQVSNGTAVISFTLGGNCILRLFSLYV